VDKVQLVSARSAVRAMRNRIHISVAVLLVGGQMACVGACDILGHGRQRLPGGYYLARWETGHVTLGGPTYSADAGGVLKGTVEAIGWNETYIVVWRLPMLAGEDAGWMIVNIHTHEIQGPLTGVQLDAARDGNQGLAGIKPTPAKQLFTE
jgi:hypothetical protein